MIMVPTHNVKIAYQVVKLVLKEIPVILVKLVPVLREFFQIVVNVLINILIMGQMISASNV